jgi:hypothetical protein
MRPRIAIGNSDLDVLERFRDVMGGHLYGPYDPWNQDLARRKPKYVWAETSYSEVTRIATLMAPFLSPRRLERARELLILPPEYYLSG